MSIKLTKQQANRAYLNMKRRLIKRYGYNGVDVPTLRAMHPAFMKAKARLIASVKEIEG